MPNGINIFSEGMTLEVPSNIVDINDVNGINDLVSEIAKKGTGSIISEDGTKDVKLDIEAEKTKIQQLLTVLRSWKKGAHIQNFTWVLQQSYAEIMHLREFLLQEQITYRVYARDTGGRLQDVTVYSLTEEELWGITTRNRDTLRLRANLTKGLKEIEEDTKRNAIVDAHMANIENGLEKIEHGQVNSATNKSYSRAYWVAKDDIINQYGGPESLPNLVWQDENGPEGKNFATRKLFNRGWIYEAFDATAAELGEKKDLLTNKGRFHRVYFTAKLDFDNLKGFKGGDVDLTQIKANMAQLMNRITPIEYLEICYNILNNTSMDPKLLAQYVIDNFKDKNLDKTTFETVKKKIIESINALKS